MLEMHQLNYSINDFNLRIENFEVKNNNIHSLLGNSGAGKSTLLNLIAGHLYPSKGDILLNSKSILHLKPNKRKIALIFQNSLLFPHMNVYENIGYALKAKKKSQMEIQNKVTLWLKRMNLMGYGKRMPHELSGGEKKRVAIARALITDPKLILMDEPLNGLDPKLRDEMINLIKTIQKETSIAILYITHDFEEALKISDTISVIKDGKIIHSGIPKELLFNPVDLSIIDFFTYYNKKKVTISNHKFNLYNNVIHSNKDGDFCCILPPQGILLSFGNSGVIIEKHYLKYGNIYLINHGEETLYAFSHEHFEKNDCVDFKIQSEFIRYKKEK